MRVNGSLQFITQTDIFWSMKYKEKKKRGLWFGGRVGPGPGPIDPLACWCGVGRILVAVDCNELTIVSLVLCFSLLNKIILSMNVSLTNRITLNRYVFLLLLFSFFLHFLCFFFPSSFLSYQIGLKMYTFYAPLIHWSYNRTIEVP